MKFVDASENGAGRIDFTQTHETISGLCVANNRLTTCTAIVILGEGGMSLIHDEGFLPLQSIEAEFTWVGKLKQWAIFCHPIKLGKEY